MVRNKLSSLRLLHFALVACLAAQASADPGAAMEPVVADVTTRAFSLVFAVDDPLTAATARVFSDAAGTDEITQSVTVRTTSASVSGAHTLGLARVDVSGLAPDTCYYTQAEAGSASGSARFPASPPFLEACTSLETRTTDSSQRPINNDLLIYEVADPMGGGALVGALLLVEAPGLGAHPLSAFVGDGSASAALVDLNNLFEPTGGRNAVVPPGALLRLVEMRGLACPDAEHRERVRFRRAPEHAEGAILTEAVRPARSFPADPLRDGVVNLADVQWVLNVFSRRTGSCGFDSDLDLVADGVINILDVQSVLNRFGETAPFTPWGGGE